MLERKDEHAIEIDVLEPHGRDEALNRGIDKTHLSYESTQPGQ